MNESNAKYKAVFRSNVAWNFPVITLHQGLFTNWSLFLAWLVTNPKLYFPLGQDLSESCKKRLEGIVLWEADVSTLGEGLTYPYDGVIKVELNVGYICLLSFLFIVIVITGICHHILGNNVQYTIKLSQFSQCEHTP